MKNKFRFGSLRKKTGWKRGNSSTLIAGVLLTAMLTLLTGGIFEAAIVSFERINTGASGSDISGGVPIKIVSQAETEEDTEEEYAGEDAEEIAGESAEKKVEIEIFSVERSVTDSAREDLPANGVSPLSSEKVSLEQTAANASKSIDNGENSWEGSGAETDEDLRYGSLSADEQSAGLEGDATFQDIGITPIASLTDTIKPAESAKVPVSVNGIVNLQAGFQTAFLQSPQTGSIDQYTSPDEEDDTYNLLLIGVDRRDATWNGNSDVMVLVTVNDAKKTIYLTSFLRDLYADIPGIGVRKLNAACANGGAKLCEETIRKNYGVKIDNYACVDFNAMIQVVDLLGGIDLTVSAEEAEVANGYIQTMCEANGDIYEEHEIVGSGAVHLDGYQAVGYSRNRFTGSGSDFGRTKRQRKVLEAIADKLKENNLVDFVLVAKELMAYVSHDISSLDFVKLLTKVPSWINYQVQEQQIPYDGMYRIENELLIPDMDATVAKLRETLY